MKEELFKGLTDEQIAKVKTCKNQEEILKLAKEEGIELTDEQLTAVSGGGCTPPKATCPNCGSTNTVSGDGGSVIVMHFCHDCKYFWQ